MITTVKCQPLDQLDLNHSDLHRVYSQNISFVKLEICQGQTDSQTDTASPEKSLLGDL